MLPSLMRDRDFHSAFPRQRMADKALIHCNPAAMQCWQSCIVSWVLTIPDLSTQSNPSPSRDGMQLPNLGVNTYGVETCAQFINGPG